MDGKAQPKDKLVFIVDDDESIRKVLSVAIGREGFRLDEAGDGEAGLQRIRASRPDLVIMDLMLPRYGGFELLRELQTGDTGGIPILVITGRYTDRSIQDLIRQESNVVDFMEKPVKLAVLTGVLHRVLGTQAPASAAGS